MNAVEENKELKIKLDDTSGLTKRHFDKIKELCVVLDKLTEENRKLKTENDMQYKQLKNLVEGKSNFLESKLEEYISSMENKIESINSKTGKDRDSELLASIKQLTSAILTHSLNDTDAMDWMHKVCSQLTDIVARTDKKNSQLGMRNRLYKNEVETLRQSHCVFNSRLYLN